MLEWSKNNPDRPGLWARRTNKTSRVTYSDVFQSDVDSGSWMDAEYCRVGDIPEIEDPVVYRDPDQRDVGNLIEVRDSHTHSGWKSLRYVGRSSHSTHFWVTEDDGGYIQTWTNARVVDTGAQNNPEPREFWLELCSRKSKGIDTIYNMPIPMVRNELVEVVHVREVL